MVVEIGEGRNISCEKADFEARNSYFAVALGETFSVIVGMKTTVLE